MIIFTWAVTDVETWTKIKITTAAIHVVGISYFAYYETSLCSKYLKVADVERNVKLCFPWVNNFSFKISQV